MSGQIFKSGSQYFTTYPEKGEAMQGYIDDYYNRMYDAAKSGSSFGKSAGAAAYGWRGTSYPNAESAYFNAVMGKEMQFAMYTGENFYSALGARPYNHEGVRIAYKLASYGKDSNNNFVGAGATTAREGNISASVKMPVAEFRQPWKEIDFRFDYGLGLQALENKDDDVIAKKAYCNEMAVNFSDLIDKTLLRGIEIAQPTVDEDGVTVESSLNSVYRCIGSGKEVGKTVGGTTVTRAMVTPYGGASSDFYSFRSKGITADTTVGNSHAQNNLDGQYYDLGGGVISLADIKRLKMACSMNWGGKTSNKAFLASPVAGNKISTLMLANNVLVGQEYITKDFNGIHLNPGREIGLQVNMIEGVPLLEDPNITFDYTNEMPSVTKMGDFALVDFDHVWMSMLTPLEMYTNNDPVVLGEYKEHNLMHMRCETRIDKFITSGRISGIQDDA